MKKILLIPMLSISMLSVSQDKGDAIVNKEQGKYIFINCKPKAEYLFLGSIAIKNYWQGNGEEMINLALKKAMKEYPEAEGLIFTRINMDRVDVIKFK